MTRISTPLRTLGFVAIAMALWQPAPAQSTDRALRVSDNGRFLVDEEGAPFFYLGDTAWELFHRLDREEADAYLRDRSSKGFTVIQAVAVAELEGLSTPNAYGDVPFTGMDPSRPNEAYFAHIDWIVDKAQSYGLFIGMLPTWGRWLGGTDGNRPNSDFFNASNARDYGRYLGRRYGDKQVIWILGGDRVADKTKRVWRRLAMGIRHSAGTDQLITYHPRGGRSSSEWFADAEWIDFHMAQSGHSPQSANYTYIEKDYALAAPKPCMDGEPAYEYPPQALPKGRPVGALQVRRNAYWAVFAGAHGHTYGAHSIWQMYDEGREPLWDVVTPWREALDLPGAVQLRHLKDLMLSRPYLTRIPDQTVLVDGSPVGIERIQATRDGTPGRRDATYIMVYFPSYRRVELNTSCIHCDTVRVWWVNPRTGAVSSPSERPNAPTMVFEPPTDADGEDWALVIDDASKGYPPPMQPL